MAALMPGKRSGPEHRCAWLPHDEDHLVDGVRWPARKRYFVQVEPGLGRDPFSLYLVRDESHAEDLALRCIDAGATEVLIQCL